MSARLCLLCALLALAQPALAERRGFTVTGFDRIVVNGPFVVRVSTGRPGPDYAEGDAEAIDAIAVQVTGRTLTVRRNVSSNWGGYPGEGGGGAAILYLTTPELEQATVIGTGDVAIDRMRGGQVIVSLGGNGRVAIEDIESDNAILNLTGAGIIEAGGHAETGRVTVQGPGTVSAAGLTIENLRINLSGPGGITIAAERQAEIIASGTGNVTVLGDAACTDRSVGAGEIVCGGFRTER